MRQYYFNDITEKHFIVISSLNTFIFFNNLNSERKIKVLLNNFEYSATLIICLTSFFYNFKEVKK